MPLHACWNCPSATRSLRTSPATCEGKIDHFIDLHDVKTTLPLHELKQNENYYIGAFLVGAYQETLGDLHNLFGDTNVVSVRISPEGSIDFINEIHGDSVADVLSYVEYDAKDMRCAVSAESGGSGTVRIDQRERKTGDNGRVR